jgi:hypothetical protein
MAVRTHLSWPWRIGLAAGAVAVVAGMWWWGFDFGQILGGFNRKEVEARIATLAADLATVREEAAALRAQNSQLESDLAMTRGTQATLVRQQQEAVHENAQLKEEIAFLQQFFAESGKPGIAIQRLLVEPNGGDLVRYSALVVRGGSPKQDFDGHVVLQADLAPAPGEPGGTARTLTLPQDEPGAEPPLRLKFKYYQRVEGTFRVPPGFVLRAVTARAYEQGVSSPRATRTLMLP